MERMDKAIKMLEGIDFLGKNFQNVAYEVEDYIQLREGTEDNYSWLEDVYDLDSCTTLMVFEKHYSEVDLSSEVVDKYLVYINFEGKELLGLSSADSNWIYDGKYDIITLNDDLVPWEYLAEEIKVEVEKYLRTRLVNNKACIDSEVSKLKEKMALLENLQSYTKAL